MQPTAYYNAVKALLIDKENNVLILRKSQNNLRHAGKSGCFNLPGGKMNTNETISEAIRREVFEETGLKMISFEHKPIFKGEWKPIVYGVTHHIKGSFFVCKKWEGKIRLNDEHDDFAWINSGNINGYNILPPEDEAILAYYSR